MQSVARAPEDFFRDFSLVVIDECHRVADEGATQYQEVVKKLRDHNPGLCILGLTATPYRLGLGTDLRIRAGGRDQDRSASIF